MPTLRCSSAYHDAGSWSTYATVGTQTGSADVARLQDRPCREPDALATRLVPGLDDPAGGRGGEQGPGRGRGAQAGRPRARAARAPVPTARRVLDPVGKRDEHGTEPEAR